MRCKLFILIFTFFALSSCKKKEQNHPQQNNNWFLIEIKSPSNFDCKIPEIIFLERKQEACNIIGYNSVAFVAAGLPKRVYTTGEKMYVTIQKPDSTNGTFCTTAGIWYPQVIITSLK
jgi:hypothetical protein